MLYQPEIGPSATALVLALVVSFVLLAVVCVLWVGRIDVKAPAEQQREAEGRS